MAHEELQKIYALDALETDKPWLKWQFRRPNERWRDVIFSHPSWSSVLEYRRKPN